MGASSPHHYLVQVLPMIEWGRLVRCAVPSHLLTMRWVLGDARQADFLLQLGFLTCIACFQPFSPQAEPSHWEINPSVSELDVLHARSWGAHASSCQGSSGLLCPTDRFAAGPQAGLAKRREQARSSKGKGRNVPLQTQKTCQKKETNKRMRHSV